MTEEYRRITITIPERLYRKLIVRTSKEAENRDVHKLSLSRTITNILDDGL